MVFIFIMSSPFKTGYSDEKSCRSRSSFVDIPKELNSVERRAFDLTNRFSQTISEAANRSYISVDNQETTTWNNHKMLKKRGDEYAQYLFEQNNKNKKEKQEAVNGVNQLVKRTLGELDEIREQENKGLIRKISDFNKDFGKKVKDLERNVAKQIEKMKLELMENISNEEKDCQRRIDERSKKLIDETIPVSKKELSESRHSNHSSTGSSPIKYSNFTPEKNNKNSLVMKRLEESREKIKELRAYEYSATPSKNKSFNSTHRRHHSGVSTYDSIKKHRSTDFQYD